MHWLNYVHAICFLVIKTLWHFELSIVRCAMCIDKSFGFAKDNDPNACVH